MFEMLIRYIGTWHWDKVQDNKGTDFMSHVFQGLTVSGIRLLN